MLIQIPLGEQYKNSDKLKVKMEEFEEPRRRIDSLLPLNGTSHLKIDEEN